MERDLRQQIEELDKQVKNLRALRQRWAEGKELTQEEAIRRNLTLELLNGAIDDLLKKKRKLKRFPSK